MIAPWLAAGAAAVLLLTGVVLVVLLLRRIRTWRRERGERRAGYAASR